MSSCANYLAGQAQSQRGHGGHLPLPLIGETLRSAEAHDQPKSNSALVNSRVLFLF